MLPTGGEKIFSNDLPVKQLMFKLYKELIGLKKKRELKNEQWLKAKVLKTAVRLYISTCCPALLTLAYSAPGTITFLTFLQLAWAILASMPLARIISQGLCTCWPYIAGILILQISAGGSLLSKPDSHINFSPYVKLYPSPTFPQLPPSLFFLAPMAF